MDIDKIAKLDMYLRAKNGSQNILDIDSLIVSDIEPQSILKFKNSAKRLAEYNVDHVENELKETWKNLFNKQVKYSFNEIKTKVSKNTKPSSDDPVNTNESHEPGQSEQSSPSLPIEEDTEK